MKMDQKKFDALEVKPFKRKKDIYFVTLYQFDKINESNPDYIRDYLAFDGENWDYGDYKDHCYVCYIHKLEVK